jgi:anti-anti-sigma regulatory factor
MLLATLRIHHTTIHSLDCPRVDATSGARLVELAAASVREGARTVVFDIGSVATIDAAGACAIEEASMQLIAGEPLVLVGLNRRARAALRTLQLLGRVRLVEWWTDVVEPTAAAA